MAQIKQTDRIIIVDDHPIVAEGLRLLIESQGTAIIVDTVTTLEAAYASYIFHQPNLTIIDLSLPDGSGLIITHRIKARDPNARILIYTFSDNPILEQRAYAAGADAYLTKTASTSELRNTIQDILKHHSNRPPMTAQGDDTSEVSRLTPREFDVFIMLSEGRDVITIAHTLSISPKTVGVHQTRIMKKLHTRNSAQLTRIAIRHELIQA